MVGLVCSFVGGLLTIRDAPFFNTSGVGLITHLHLLHFLNNLITHRFFLA